MNNDYELNLTNISKELQLILEIIKFRNGERISDEWFADVDWDVFLQLVLHHRIYPLLYVKVLKMESSLIPQNIVQTLSQYYKKNTFQMLHLSGEMESLSKLFLENNIRLLFLKGPVLSADLYGDISKRTCGDLDILIPIDDLDKANEMLTDIGYERDEYIKTVLNDWKWRHHHFTYYHPVKGTKVEIHWRLNPAPSKEPSFNELWERKRKSPITNYPTYFLDQKDLFFFLVTHGARHGWSRLRWLVDIHQITKNGLHWAGLYKKLNKYQSLHIAGQALILSSQLLNTAVSKDIQPLLSTKRAKILAEQAVFYLERMVNLHTDPVPEDVAKYHANHLFTLMSFQQKLAYCLSVLHPYYTDAETLPLPRKLHFLYFPLRPFLWVWRKTKKHALP